MFEAKDALNMEIGPDTPIGGPSVRKSAGNIIIQNPLLPSGRNKALAWTFDQAAMVMYWINWNENPDNQAIYSYSETNGFGTVLQRNLLFTENSKPSIAFVNGYLTWTDFNIPEPRQYNLEGTYAEPIQEWELYQIQHVPLVPLGVTADVTAVANYQPKPMPNTPNVGYQFAYNYEYQRSVEGRMSEPTLVYWNETLTLTIPDSEIYGYLQKNSASNPYVVAIRFYYRQGNEGDWVYFRRLKNEGLGPLNYAIEIDPITAITAIGFPSRAALLAADGIAPYVDDLKFANNRLAHGKIRTGYNAVLPTATAEIRQLVTNMELRNWRVFPPILEQKVPLALSFYTKESRFIGARPINMIDFYDYFDGFKKWNLDCKDVYDYAGGGSFNLSVLPWDQVVDYIYNIDPLDQTTPYSRNDVSPGVPYIKITPSTEPLPAEAHTVVLSTISKNSFTSWIRTQSRPFFIYQDSNGIFYPFLDNVVGQTIEKDSIQMYFYGIGFEFNSGEPINFSTEQNYFVRVCGYLFTYTNTNVSFMATLDRSAEFKITNQLGNILISKQSYVAFGSSNSFYSGGYFSSVDVANSVPNLGPYNHQVCDVVLYAKAIEPPTTWNNVPGVSWTIDEWAAQTPKDYYGDSYGTGDEKVMGGEARQVYGTAFDGQYTQVGQMPWEGFFASMNLNGIYQENWASDIGSATVLDEDPRQRELIQAIRHSDPFVANTGINLMFTFDPLNEIQVANQLGALTKMVVLSVNNQSGANLYAVCEAGVEMIFLGKTQQTGTDGNSVMSLSTSVFGSTNVLQISYGAKDKLQVVETNVGIAWFWDETNAALVQVSNNGLDPVSIQKSFQSQAMQVGPDAIIGYNPLWKQVVVSSLGEGLAYNFRTDIYPGRRTFNEAPYPEMFAWMASGQRQQSMFGFYEGNLYRFNEGNTLAGEDFPCSVTFVVNQGLDVLKKAKAIEILSPNQTPMDVLITTDTGLISTIAKDAFEFREGNGFAAFKQAENTAGGKANGADLHGYLMEIQLSDEGRTNNQITFVKIKSSEAQTNQK